MGTDTQDSTASSPRRAGTKRHCSTAKRAASSRRGKPQERLISTLIGVPPGLTFTRSNTVPSSPRRRDTYRVDRLGIGQVVGVEACRDHRHRCGERRRRWWRRRDGGRCGRGRGRRRHMDRCRRFDREGDRHRRQGRDVRFAQFRRRLPSGWQLGFPCRSRRFDQAHHQRLRNLAHGRLPGQFDRGPGQAGMRCHDQGEAGRTTQRRRSRHERFDSSARRFFTLAGEGSARSEFSPIAACRGCDNLSLPDVAALGAPRAGDPPGSSIPLACQGRNPAADQTAPAMNKS